MKTSTTSEHFQAPPPVDCPCCKHKISEKAWVCPSCGWQSKEHIAWRRGLAEQLTTSTKILLVFSTIAIIAMLLALAALFSSPTSI